MLPSDGTSEACLLSDGPSPLGQPPILGNPRDSFHFSLPENCEDLALSPVLEWRGESALDVWSGTVRRGKVPLFLTMFYGLL